MRRSRKLLFASGVLAALLATAALAPTTVLALPTDEADVPIPSEGSLPQQSGGDDTAGAVSGSDEARHEPSPDPAVIPDADGETVVTETPATPDDAQTDVGDVAQDGSDDPADDMTDGDPATSPQVPAPSLSLSTSASPQSLPSSQQTSAHEYTWLVTSEYGHGLQRYLLDHGTIATAGLHDLGNGVWTYVRPDYSFVVRGRWVDPETGYVYLADNDGVLEAPGWVVSSAYGQGLQRYYVDPDAHACVPGVSEEGWTHLTTSSGYVLRGAGKVAGRLCYADNDGLLTTDGWLVTSAFGQGLQRYWFVDGSAAEPGRVYETGDGERTYVTSKGYVLRGALAVGDLVYLADNDGRLASDGWVVSSAYGQGLQRYWIDPDTHSAVVGFSEDGWAHVTTSKGYVLRGAGTVDGRRYYADNDGRLLERGWLVTSAFGQGLQRYWFEDHTTAPAGARLTEGDVWTYVTGNGYVLRGALAVGDLVYLADNDGRLAPAGWVVSSAYGQGLQRYWVDAEEHAAVVGFSEDGWAHVTTPKGYVLRGAGKVDGRLYYANNDGLLKTDGWVVTSGFGQGLQRYWFEGGHAADEGLYETPTGWCYVRPEGFVVRGAYDTGHGKVYLADNDGNLPTETGWLVTSRYGSGLQRYYIDAVSHAALTAHFEVDGSHYWGVANKGYVLRGTMRMGGGMLLAGNDGVLAWDEGWLVTSRYDGSVQRYRIDTSPGGGMMGARVGLFSLGGKQYYGREDTGYVVRGYYVNPSGVLYYGNNDGVLGRPPALYSDMASKAQGYSSNTGWLILVDTRGNRVAVYTGSRGAWNATREWRCTTGAPWSPTVKGEFTVTGKGYSFGTSTYTCYYYTQFYGDYLFHSVLYDAGTFNLQDGTIGANASHGCVRLELANAKWIYDNVPYGTKVVVY